MKQERKNPTPLGVGEVKIEPYYLSNEHDALLKLLKTIFLSRFRA